MLTLPKPTLNEWGASLKAVSGPPGLAWRYSLTAKPSPLSSVTLWALTTSMPDTCMLRGGVGGREGRGMVVIGIRHSCKVEEADDDRTTAVTDEMTDDHHLYWKPPACTTTY